MLSDLLPLKSSSSVNIRASLNSELIVTPELSSMLLKLFRNTFSKRPATIVDGALCVQNSTNDKTCQTTYLSFQWLTRVAECEGFLVALLPYSELAESLKRIMGENVMSRLPTPDWRTKLDAADINIIDYDNLTVYKPKMVYDLPTGGRRIIQKSSGYSATIKSGIITYENDKATGELPGTLIRGEQKALVA